MKRFKAILLLFIFLASIKGYSFEMHYCKGKITDVSFIGHAECVCHHDDSKEEAVEHGSTCEENCHSKKLDKNISDNLIKDSGCCKTEQITYMTSSVKALSNSELPVVMLFIAAINPLFFGIETEYNSDLAKNYSPPIIVEDITILVRTFLI